MLELWVLAVAAEVPAASEGIDFLAPIVSTGVVGIFLLMLLFRIKIMPTYVYDEAKADWERERQEKDEALEIANRALQAGNKVYVEQVIPTLTRALDAERELLDLRREEQWQQRQQRP